jgi:hypothetical protein
VLGLALGAALFALVPTAPEPAAAPTEEASAERRAEPSPSTPASERAPEAGARAAEAPGSAAEARTAALAAAPRVRAAPRYHPRPAGEWQGMLVDLSLQPACDRADGCGLAMACIAGRCGPCRVDAECAAGEVCVLDHCVPGGAAACRSAADCPAGALCVLDGYSADPRGNAAMNAACQSRSGGASDEREPRPEPPPDAYAPPRPVSPDALRESLPAGGESPAVEDDAE